MNSGNDTRIESNIPLPAPALLHREIPRYKAQAAFVSEARQQIRNILFGDDGRLLLAVGPCSIHDAKAGIEYATRLRDLADRVSDHIFIVMRSYVEKPCSLGWKGLIMDPNLDGSDNIPDGLRQARVFLREVIELGLPTATELLGPITSQSIGDLVCWSIIGARTSESQTYRQLASGISMPLGFKNSTGGNTAPAVQAIFAASKPQAFLGFNMEGVASKVQTPGNPDCHIILRGGSKGPNYSAEHVAQVERMLEEAELPQTIVIDCAHGNSPSDHNHQTEVFHDIIDQRKNGTRSIVGAMLESNLVAGNQKFPNQQGLTYGQSITDACLDWDTTERIVLEAATQLNAKN
jgi:3-deoxy-7-phosphoheptulonate synthase